MTNGPDAPPPPPVQGGPLQMGQLKFEVIAYVIPEKFPDGLDLMGMKPGSLTPEVHCRVGKGGLIVAIPPGKFAEDIYRELLRRQAEVAKHARAVIPIK